MLDHMSLTVRDFGVSRDFYRRALEPLGYGVQMEFEGACGIGSEGKPFFWLHQGDVGRPTHFAFVAKDRPSVDAFHAASVGAGATDNGGPGIRKDYHPNYYAAFVFDPDGNNVEAVCHRPAAEASSTRAPARRKVAPSRAPARTGGAAGKKKGAARAGAAATSRKPGSATGRRSAGPAGKRPGKRRGR